MENLYACIAFYCVTKICSIILGNTQDQNSHHKHVKQNLPQKDTKVNVGRMNGKTEPSLGRLDLIPMAMAIHSDIILVM